MNDSQSKLIYDRVGESTSPHRNLLVTDASPKGRQELIFFLEQNVAEIGKPRSLSRGTSQPRQSPRSLIGQYQDSLISS
jgi:hypothetical protein